MADFTALKTAIQNAIKQNGNEEITGAILQEVMLAVVTTLGDGSINELITALSSEAQARGNADTELSNRLGSTITAQNTAAAQIGAEAEARAAADTALQGLIDGITDNIENGYVYAGIATPSSTPTTGKVFYLALTAGTYTNFGNIAVTQGINILKYNGSAWSLDFFIGIDDTPTPSSNNLVKSGGIFDSIMTDGSAFDISAYFASGGTLATYANLSAALTALNALSASYKKGGMSIKFVQSSDNKYVQYRLMSDSFNTTTANWQGVDDTPTAGSDNLVKSGGVYQELDVRTSQVIGTLFFAGSGDNTADRKEFNLLPGHTYIFKLLSKSWDVTGVTWSKFGFGYHTTSGNTDIYVAQVGDTIEVDTFKVIVPQSAEYYYMWMRGGASAKLNVQYEDITNETEITGAFGEFAKYQKTSHDGEAHIEQEGGKIVSFIPNVFNAIPFYGDGNNADTKEIHLRNGVKYILRLSTISWDVTTVTYSKFIINKLRNGASTTIYNCAVGDVVQREIIIDANDADYYSIGFRGDSGVRVTLDIKEAYPAILDNNAVADLLKGHSAIITSKSVVVNYYGDDSNAIGQKIKLVRNRLYKLVLSTTSWSVSSISSSWSKFIVSRYLNGAKVGADLVNVSDLANLQNEYTIFADENDYYEIVFRGDAKTTMSVVVEDITLDGQDDELVENELIKANDIIADTTMPFITRTDTSGLVKKLTNPYQKHYSQQFMGQLHCHTWNHLLQYHTKESVVANYEMYASLGYDFMTVTNYPYFDDLTAQPKSGDLLWLCNSYETGAMPTTIDATHQNTHIVCFNAKNVISDTYFENTDINDVIDDVVADGCIVTLAHPMWYSGPDGLQTLQTKDQLLHLSESIKFVEVYNSYSQSGIESPYVANPAYALDVLASAGRKLWGTAVTDSHNHDGYAEAVEMGGNVKVFAKEKSRSAIWESLMEGNFYSCEYYADRLSSISVDRNVLTINVGVNATIKFIGKDATLLSQVTGSVGQYQITGYEKYVRAEITMPSGKRIWTNPIYID